MHLIPKSTAFLYKRHNFKEKGQISCETTINDELIHVVIAGIQKKRRSSTLVSEKRFMKMPIITDISLYQKFNNGAGLILSDFETIL